MQTEKDLKPLSRRQFLRLAPCAPFAGIATARASFAQMARAEADYPAFSGTMRLFLAGDVMLGRGIDQILPHPGDPHLFEPSTSSALTYLELAEAANGPISRPVDFSYVWGDGLDALEAARADARIINLETSITKSTHPDPKGINYKMSPDNIACLAVLRVDCCSLANNHVLDWGEPGLLETIESLEAAHIAGVGAGRDAAQAKAPAILNLAGGAKIVVFGFGIATSGIPKAWSADEDRPGVNFLDRLSAQAISAIAAQARPFRQPGNVLVASIHWGANWGYDVPDEERYFAHRLIDDAGFDIIHGHSAHHAKAIEVYRERLILYGCGDFLNDYEGISGYESFRDDLAVMYFASCSAAGTLAELKMIPFRIRKFRLQHASKEDALWLKETLDRESTPFGTRITLEEDNSLHAKWR